MIGKNAQGLRGFPTPNTPSGAAAYLLMYFEDETWAQYALGALRALEAGYNWYDAGTMSPDDAAEAFRLIDQQAPLNKLPSCSLPDGQPLMRLNPANGHIQHINDAEMWEDDPDLPVTPERPVAPPEDQRCLAAANAALALQQLYENLSDSFNSGLEAAEAITALVATVGTVLTAEFAPPVSALIAIAGIVFEGVVYPTLEFLTADVWDANFTAVMQCYLYNCSSVTSNVVTFDYCCVLEQFAAAQSAQGLDLSQIRLFGQIYYLLSWIGSQGLDYAGSGTAITSADCTCTWCYEFDFTLSNGGWSAVTFNGKTATWVSGQGWSASAGGLAAGASIIATITKNFDTSFVVGSHVEIHTVSRNGSVTIATSRTGVNTGLAVTTASQDDLTQDHTWDANSTDFWVRGQANAPSAGVVATGTVYIRKVKLFGNGDNPFGLDNC